MNYEYVYIVTARNIKTLNKITIGVYKDENKAEEMFNLYNSDINWGGINIEKCKLE